MKKEGDVMEGGRVNTSNMPPKRARRAAICCVTTPTRRSGRTPVAGQVVAVGCCFCFFVWLLGSAGTWGCAGRADALLKVRGGMLVPRPGSVMPYMRGCNKA